MVETGMKCVKYLLFFFNFLFFFSGIAIITVGALVQSQITKYDSVVDGASFTAGAILLIVVGVVVTVLSFFACCGAIKENHCMVLTFAVLLGIIFVLELAAGITCYVYRGEIDRLAAEGFNSSWSRYDPDVNSDYAHGIDVLQQDLKCCGVNSSKDWATFPWGKKHPGQFPDSCCVEDTPGCGKKPDVKIYTKGCYSEIKTALDTQIVIVAGVGIGVAFIQIIGVILACCLASAIRKNYQMV